MKTGVRYVRGAGFFCAHKVIGKIAMSQSESRQYSVGSRQSLVGNL